ncbi:MAG: SPOR domain-containing protein [Bacteroidales bacterium]|nr:SPOR domain-containing protein [Bacteroidales bacterium]
MVELINHIEKLILTHNCVIIPELGGFVVRQRQAQIQGNEHLIIPPGKEIGFNTELKHNDGLLAEMYMKAHQVDYSAACIMLENDVCALKARLKEERKVSLGQLGRLFLNERSVMEFESSAELIFPEYYGLAPFRCVELRYLEQPKSISLAPKEKEEFIHIRIQRSFVRQIAAFAAAVLVFVLISTPVKNPQTDYASILYAGHDTNQKEQIIDTPVETIVPLTEETSDNLPSVDSTVLTTQTAPVVAAQPIADEPVQAVTPTQYNGRTYYIVVGSVETIKAAERQVADQKAKGFSKAGYIERDDRVRVYVESFTDKKMGEQAVIDYRIAHPEHKDAWLFSAR